MKVNQWEITKIMLNNWVTLAKIRNYFCTGFFLDFFIKKTALSFLVNAMQFSIMFLEKFIVERLFKNAGSLFSFTSYLQNKFTHKLLGVMFILINVILLVLVYFTCL